MAGTVWALSYGHPNQGMAMLLVSWNPTVAILEDKSQFLPCYDNQLGFSLMGSRIPPGFLSDFLNFDPSEGFFSRSGVEGLWLISLAALFHLPNAKRTVQRQKTTTAPIRATSFLWWKFEIQAWTFMFSLYKSNKTRLKSTLIPNAWKYSAFSITARYRLLHFKCVYTLRDSMHHVMWPRHKKSDPYHSC